MDYVLTPTQRTAWITLTGLNAPPERHEDMLRIAGETYRRRVDQVTPDLDAVLGLFQLAVELGVLQLADEEELRKGRNGSLMRRDRLDTQSAND